MRPIPFLLLTCALAGPASAALVINEILPDPPGSDAGHEFVEFLNTGPEVVDLEGVAFEFANGAEGPVWRRRWEGAAGAVLAPGQRFLLVDRTWADEPPGDDAATLALQNGPDAVRLVRGQEVLDLLGYGALTDPELSEGTPAVLVPGLALARRPDGQDSGDNGADFTAAAPSPGALNFRRWSAAATEVELEPPSLARPLEAVTLRLLLRNDGLEAWPPADAVLSVGGDRVSVRLDGLAHGAERTVAWVARPRWTGRWPLALALRPPGAPDSLRLDLGRLQVGAGVLVLNEVLAAPDQGQGEWCELLASPDGPVDLAGWQLREEDGGWVDLPPARLAAGGLCVVAQDSAALAAWLLEVHARGGSPLCPPADVLAQVLPLPRWPTLNNSAPDSRAFADRLRLRDPAGVTVDHVVIGAAGAPAAGGRSLERTGAQARHPTGRPWAVCTAGPGATPGCANSTLLIPATGDHVLQVVPPVLDAAAGAGAVHAVFTLPARSESWRLRVFDLWGSLVRDFGGDDLGPGPRDLLWDGRDDQGRSVPAGGYVFALEVRDEAGRAGGARRLCAVR